MNNGDDAGALAILNSLRANVGLSPLPAPSGGVTMMDYLLSERFAELFMEGHRANDLYRFGLTQQLLDAGDFVESIPDRAIKFPMASSEAINNPNIEDDAAVRCTPTT